MLQIMMLSNICLRNLRVTESFADFIQECQSQMSEMRLRELCGRGRSVLENRITIENWAIASVPSDIPGQSHQPFPVKVRCDGDCLQAVFSFGQDVRIYANHVAIWACGKCLVLQVYCKCESAQSIPKFLLTVSFEPSYTG